MKAAQILATYFGTRRHYPFNKEGVQDVLNRQVETLCKLDLGYDTDLIIVNHDNQDPFAHDFLQSINGVQLKNGQVRILHRPIVSQDVSFGSYKYAYYMHRTEYDYWFFNEDDVLPQKSGLVQKMINQLNSDSSIGFVAALQFANGSHVFQFNEMGYISATGGHMPHAHGGVGLTSTAILDRLVAKYPLYLQTPNILLQKNELQDYLTLEGGYGGDHLEIDFTNAFVKAGYNLVCSSEGDDFLRLQDNSLL
jgi:hypothetical protein